MLLCCKKFKNESYPFLISKNVEIKLFKKDNNGKKEYTGKLKAFNQEEIIIETDKEIAIERKNIAQIKTIYEW